MSIKSDRWIYRQCTPPNFIVTEMVPHIPDPKNSLMIQLKSVEYPSWSSAEQLQIHCQSNRAPVGAGMTGFRKPTDKEIADFKPMIEPFSPYQIRAKGGALCDPPADYVEQSGDQFEMMSWRTPLEKVISYGTSSYGYDIRCSNEFKIFTNINSTIVDPKNFDEKNFVDFKGDVCIIPPNSFALARTVEYFRIPRNVLTVCLGKSTYARCGIIVNVTPFEPEWEGYVTLEFSNTTPLPAKIYANEGCAQVLFLESDEECAVSYKDRNGKYQGQQGITLPKA